MKMWKVLNWLFGWHYVWLKDCGNSHICRVEMLPNRVLCGTVVYQQFFITQEGRVEGGYHITEWKPLTWEFKKPTVIKLRCVK